MTHKHHVVTVYYWLIKVIKSITDLSQVETCRKLIQNYESLYETTLRKRGYDHLSLVLRHELDNRYWFFAELKMRRLAGKPE